MQIVVNPRVHMGLVSMHESALRRNGGIGFSISKPNAKLTITPSNNFSLTDHRQHSFSQAEIMNLKYVIDDSISKHQLTSNIQIFIEGKLGTHLGMGSGTAIRLACLEALFIINEFAVSRSDLVGISKRGGTSGIGINTYFDGGLVFDLGRATGVEQITPSSVGRIHSLPLPIQRLDFPNWKMGVCIPNDVDPKTQEEELEFFRSNTPISSFSSFEACYYALFGIYAAILDKNLNGLCRAVQLMQSTEWKQLERNLYGDFVSSTEKILYERGALCVGMSSLGPMLYFFYDEEFDFNLDTSDLRWKVDCFECEPSNYGRQIWP